MGVLGLSFGAASMITAVASRFGPSRLAEGYAWALVMSWAGSNILFIHADPDAVSDTYLHLHAVMAAALGCLLLRRSTLWNLAAAGVMGAHFVVQALYLCLDQQAGAYWLYTLETNLLFALEIACVWLSFTTVGQSWSHCRWLNWM